MCWRLPIAWMWFLNVGMCFYKGVLLLVVCKWCLMPVMHCHGWGRVCSAVCISLHSICAHTTWMCGAIFSMYVCTMNVAFYVKK